MPAVITAKYRARCPNCPSPIKPGEQIAQAGAPGGAGWVHVQCHPDGEVVASALAEPKRAVKGTGRTKTSSRGKQPARSSPWERVEEPAHPGAVEVHTDGACSGNPGPGGWAWATSDGRQDSGNETVSTNQRMEIRAALEAVTALDGPLVVVSDSTYVVHCFRDRWWSGWQSRGWLNSKREPVANRDLWEPLVDLIQQRGNITFRWVKGHSGDPMNDLVDRLAVAAAAEVSR